MLRIIISAVDSRGDKSWAVKEFVTGMWHQNQSTLIADTEKDKKDAQCVVFS